MNDSARAAIAGELAPTGLALTLLSSSAGPDLVPARDVPMDGALVYMCDPTSPAVDLLLRRKLPLVFVDTQQPVDGIASVNVDDRAGARAAARYLVDLGHRQIGLVMSGLRGPVGLIDDPAVVMAVDGYPSAQRTLGWFDVLDQAGIQLTIVRTRDAEANEVRNQARLLLDRDDRPTGVLCFSDAVAVGVLQTASELDLSVPRDLSVVGFDDSSLAGRIRPALTTVRQDIAEKGRTAAAALTVAIGQSRSNVVAETHHVMLPTELIVRDSTAPPSGT